MRCDVCANLIQSICKLVAKATCRTRLTQDSIGEKEIVIETFEEDVKENITGTSPQNPNVAPCGDIGGKSEKEALEIIRALSVPNVESEVEDFDSWTDEDVLELESESSHPENDVVLRNDSVEPSGSNDKLDKYLKSTVAMRSPDKDADSLTEFLEGSEESLEKEKQEEEDSEHRVDEFLEEDQAFRRILKMTKELTNVSVDEALEEVSSMDNSHSSKAVSEEFQTELTSGQIIEPSSYIRAVMNRSDPSSVTSDEIFTRDDKIDPSGLYCKLHDQFLVEPSPCGDSKVGMHTQSGESSNTRTQIVDNDQSSSEAAVSSTATSQSQANSGSHPVSKSEKCEPISLRAHKHCKYRVRTRRCQAISMRHDVSNSGDIAAKLRRGGVVKASPRLPGYFLLSSFLNNACCRCGVRSMTTVRPQSSKRQRQVQAMRLAVREILLGQQPQLSVINTTLCGSFRLIGKPVRMRAETRKHQSIPISLVFGLRSSNIGAFETGQSPKHGLHGNLSGSEKNE